MSETEIRYPLLDRLYQRYLADEDSASFIFDVASQYRISTLKRLAVAGQRISRRASVLALGFLGDFAVNEVMGCALSDGDRAVRLLADHGIRQVWKRQGNPTEQAAIQRLYRLSALDHYEQLADESTLLIVKNPALGEAWNQRAIARWGVGDFRGAADDCREALNCNRYHFPSAMGMAHCCLQLDDPSAALDCFRLAISINPELEGVRNHISRLEKKLDC